MQNSLSLSNLCSYKLLYNICLIEMKKLKRQLPIKPEISINSDKSTLEPLGKFTGTW